MNRFGAGRCCGCGVACDTYTWTFRTTCSNIVFVFSEGTLISSLNLTRYSGVAGRQPFSHGMTDSQVRSEIEADGLLDHLYFGPGESLFITPDTFEADDRRDPSGPGSDSYSLNENVPVVFSRRQWDNGGMVAYSGVTSHAVVNLDRGLQTVTGACTARTGGDVLYSLSIRSGSGNSGSNVTVVASWPFFGVGGNVTTSSGSLTGEVRRVLNGTANDPFPTADVTITSSRRITTAIDTMRRGAVVTEENEWQVIINGEVFGPYLNTTAKAVDVRDCNTANTTSSLSSGPSASIQFRLIPVGRDTPQSVITQSSGLFSANLSGSETLTGDPAFVVSQTFYRLFRDGSFAASEIYVDDATQTGTLFDPPQNSIDRATYIFTLDVSGADPRVDCHINDGVSEQTFSDLLLDDTINNLQLPSGQQFAIRLTLEGPFTDCQPNGIDFREDGAGNRQQQSSGAEGGL